MLLLMLEAVVATSTNSTTNHKQEVTNSTLNLCIKRLYKWLRRTLSNFNYKPQVESRRQHLALYMDRHLHSVAIKIEVTSHRIERTHFNLDYSQMPAVALQ